MPIRVTLFGRGEIIWNGEPVRLRSAKVLELVAYLALHPKGATRAESADALWPDLPSDRRRHNLRQILVYARQLDEELIKEQRDLLLIGPDIEVDSLQIDGLAASNEVDDLKKAADAYTGPLLANRAGEWIGPFRDRAATAHLGILLRLAELLANDDPAESLRFAELSIAEDALSESARMAQLRALELTGQHVKAIEALHQYRRLIRSELGIEAAPALFRVVSLEPPEEGQTDRQRRPTLSPLQTLQQETARAPVYLQSGRLAEGRTRLSAALDGVPFATDEKSRGLAALSRLDYEAGAFHLALTHATRADEESVTRRSQVLAKIARARAYMGQSRLEEARAALDFVKRRNLNGEPEIASEALTLIALLSYYGHRPNEAYRQAQRALRLAEEAHAPFLQVIAMNAMASSLFKLDKLNDAIALFRKAIKTAEIAYMPLRVGYLSASLGRILEAQGDYASARASYLRAFELFKTGEAANYQAIAGTYLGEWHLREREPDVALEWHRRSFAIRRTLGDRLGLATSLRGLGKAYADLGRSAEAIEHLRQAIRVYQAVDDEYGPATCLVPLSAAYLATGDVAKAQELLTRAEDQLSMYADRVAESFEDRTLSAEAIEALRSRINAA